jgi:perosamine synthetase
MKKIPLFKTDVSWQSIANVVRVLRSGYLGEGPEVKAFEKEFEAQFGFKDLITLNSGTSALEMAYDLVGISEGDEVVTTVFTAPATNLPLARRKANIVFADIEEDLNVSIADVERKITDRTKAVVFVHINGNNRGLDEIVALCAKKNIPLIEDAAQAVGSDNWGKGDFVCLSFQAIKTFTTGDGGALLVKDPALAAKARRLRWFGIDRTKGQLGAVIEEAGYKYHMNDINAAIGRGNLRTLPKRLAHRRELVEEYRRLGVSAYPWCAFTLSDRRDELRAELLNNGISAEAYNNRNDAQPVFGGRRDLPVMGGIEHRYLFLPLHGGVTVEDVRRICAIIQAFNSADFRFTGKL